MGRRPTPGNPTPGEGNPQLRLRLAPAIHAQVAAQGNEWAASVLQVCLPSATLPEDEAGWLQLWATNPAAANTATMHLARTLPPHLAGALEAARLLRPYETVDCQEMAARALATLQQMQARDATHPLNGGNAKSAAPTEGAALEMPGLVGGQMVTLPQLSEGSGQSTSTG